jgi:hypothetical protein
MHIDIKPLDQYPQSLMDDIDYWDKQIFASSAEAADRWADPDWQLVV